MTAIWLPGAAPPRVAFAVGRPVGNAVTRNQVKRRLRAALRTLGGAESGSPDRISGGAWLIRAGPDAGERSYAGLRADLAQAVHAVQRR